MKKNISGSSPSWSDLELLTLFVFLRFYLFIFRERGKEGERGREIHQLVASRMRPNMDLALNPGRCPNWESNP